MSTNPADVIVGLLLIAASVAWLVFGWREANRTIAAVDRLLEGDTDAVDRRDH